MWSMSIENHSKTHWAGLNFGVFREGLLTKGEWRHCRGYANTRNRTLSHGLSDKVIFVWRLYKIVRLFRVALVPFFRVYCTLKRIISLFFFFFLKQRLGILERVQTGR